MGFFGFGIRNILDQQQRFTSTHVVYLRVKNFPDVDQNGKPEVYAELGIPVTPSDPAQGGTTDIQIDPPPTVKEISLHNLGLFGGRLNFGSCLFRVSYTWVLTQMQQLGITDPLEVFRNRDGKSAVGLIYHNRLFAIENIFPIVWGGQTTEYKIVGNAMEQTESQLGGQDAPNPKPLTATVADSITLSDSTEMGE